MRSVFDEPEVEERAQRRDTEVTLGAPSLLLLLFGLLTLVGLSFGFGYSLGHREPVVSATSPLPAGTPQTADRTSSSASKPSAVASNSVAQAESSPESDPEADSEQEQSPPPVSPPARSSENAAAPPAGATPPLTVKPALVAVDNPIQARPAQVATTQSPAPGSLMVQIAAVSQAEDADVLMSALHRRGYAVAARREPLDGLIHVRIGPFKTPADAESWRQKLLNDGYNAVIQP